MQQSECAWTWARHALRLFIIFGGDRASFVCSETGRSEMELAKWEKALLPGFLLVFQGIFIILYGLLVRYDDTGKPHTANEVFTKPLESSETALKVYPRKLGKHGSMHTGR